MVDGADADRQSGIEKPDRHGSHGRIRAQYEPGDGGVFRGAWEL